MKERAERIVYLLNTAEGLRSASSLAASLGVSRRTIISDIAEIKDTLIRCGAHLFIKPGQGYRLIVDDPVLFNRCFQLTFTRNQIVNDPAASRQERIIRLARKLVSRTEPVKIEELADQLYLSSNAIRRDLDQAYQLLKEYSLNVVRAARSGLRVQGLEKHRRLCLIDLAGMHYNLHLIQSEDQEYQHWLRCSAEEATAIRRCLIQTLRTAGIRVTDDVTQRIAAYLVVLRQRCIHQLYIELDEKERQAADELPEIRPVTRLFELLRQNHTGYRVSRDEQRVVAELLAGYRDQPDQLDIWSFSESQFMQALRRSIPDFIPLIDSETLSGRQFLGSLSHLCSSLSLRRQFDLREMQRFSNYGMEEEIQRSPVSYYYACRIRERIEVQLKTALSAQDLMLLTIAVCRWIDAAAFPVKKLRLLTHTFHGLEASRWLIDRFQQRFGSTIESNEPVELYEVRLRDQQNIDAILLHLPEFAYHEQIPPFFTDLIPTQSDTLKFWERFILPATAFQPALPPASVFQLNPHPVYHSEAHFLASLSQRHARSASCARQLRELLNRRYGSQLMTTNQEIAVLIADPALTGREIIELSHFSHAVKWKNKEIRMVLFLSLSAGSPQKIKALENLTRQLQKHSEQTERLLRGEDPMSVFISLMTAALREQLI